MTGRPTRRTPQRKYRDYRRYKSWLREDFGHRCGYCQIHEIHHGGDWHFQVDHFRPKSRPEFLHLACEYSNLLYSCDHCNNMKRDLWPSDQPLVDGIGWLDPCDHDLADHYYYGFRDEAFELVCVTKIGRWMALTLGLDQPARISRRRILAEEERVDQQTVITLRQLLDKLISKNDAETDPEIFVTIEEIIRKLDKKTASIQKRYESMPMEKLRLTRLE